MFRRCSLVLASMSVALVGVAGTSHSSTVSAAGTRNPYQQPFASTSIWNTPIGSGAVYVPAGIAPPTARTLTADQTLTLMDPSAPMTAIAANGGQHSDRCIGGGQLTSAPIPPSLMIPSGTANYGYAVLGADGSSLTEGNAFARCTPGGPATAWGAKSVGSIYGDGLVGSAGGSGLSILGGILRVNEFVPGGQVNHAVRVNLDGAADLFGGPNGFRWPATHEDGYGPTGYGGTNPALKMGALLALPANVSLASLGLTSGPGLILARALQDFGAYVSNDTAAPVFTIDTETGDASMTDQFQSVWGFPFQTAGVGGSPWANDVMTILQHLAVVDNNGPNSIGGGGTPLVPPAPPLSGVGSVPLPTSSSSAGQTGLGQHVGAPQVAVTPDGSQQLVFWKSTTTSQLNEAWFAQGSWHGPISFPQLGALTSTPAVAVTKDGSTQLVFWQGPGGHLFEAWFSGSWNGPVDITGAALNGQGALASAPSVVTTRDGSQLVFWRGSDGHFGEAWYSAGGWHGPIDFAGLGSLASAPSATITPDGSTQLVFFQGLDNHLNEDWFTLNAWHGPVDFAGLGTLASSPSVAVTPDSSTQIVFSKSPAGHLQEDWFTQGSWHGPADITNALGGAGLLTSAPSATITTDGSTQLVFWQGAGATLWEAWYAQGSWHGPVNFSA